MKVGKRLLRDNTGPGGSLDTNKFMRAIMQFRNTPMQDCRRSPAQMVFGRTLRDFLPAMIHKYEPAKDWVVTQEYRERTLAMKREMDDKRWSHNTRDLDALPIGTPVSIQNQTGNHPNKWDKTGIILENQPHSKVVIRVDGSRRITTRNRRFVRQLNPALRMGASPKSVMRKEKKSNPVSRKERKNQVPDHEDPIHEVPTADVHQDHPRDDVGADLSANDGRSDRGNPGSCPEADYNCVPADVRVDDDYEGTQQVIEAPPEMNNHIPDPVLNVEGGSRPKRSPKPNHKYSPEIYDLSYVGNRTRSRRSIRRAGPSSRS